MKKTWIAAGLLGLAAALAFFASMADYAFPGESAFLISCWRGLEPVACPRYPLMAAFVRLLGGGNLVAPIAGVLAVLALYPLVRLFVATRVAPEVDSAQQGALAGLAALVASVAFMLSPAVRSAATHLEPRMFDFAWALLPLVLALPFLSRFSWLCPVLMGLAWAPGLADSALALAFVPFHLALLSHAARRNGRDTHLAMGLFAVSGLAALFAVLWLFGLELHPFVRRTIAELNAYDTVPGWFFVFIFTTFPLVLLLFFGDEPIGERPGIVQQLFHAALSFVAILAVATPLSPYCLMEPYGYLPVATSAFAAAVAGYLVAYWWFNRRAWSARLVGGLLALALAGSALWNLVSFDGEAGAFADGVADRIVDGLDGRRTLVTDGALDSHIRLAAARKGRDVRLVPQAQFLDERRRTEFGDVTNDVAVFAAPDVLHSAGFAPVPETLFFGADERRVPDGCVPTDLVADGGGRAVSPADRLRRALRRYFGLVANNRGVWLQQHGKDEAAFAAYERVLNDIDRDNVSALVNEAVMARAKHPAAQAKKDEIDACLKALAEGPARGILWRLGAVCGYVRDPDAAVRLGYDWARSGAPGVRFLKVRRVSSEDRLLALDISRSDEAAAERRASEILKKNPDEPLANYVMGSLALGRGRVAEAERHLRKAADAAEPVALALNDLAEVLRRNRNYAEAERYARKCTQCAPLLYVGWETLGAVLMDSGRNLDEAESAIRRACELSKGANGREADARMLVSLARIQLKRGDRAHAQVTIRKIQSRLSELSAFERREFEALLK